ncbi:hypothetical protein CDO46_01575 [Pigmentiphaga sp. NML030171]|uniref:EAL domain-containing protein n=1 Tax=Pigmentiphaga sp. NML030171 TaxID=2008676 RepID=UPI000B419235|nr:EAL domain-containing protein [Pigmentiphaga sp. NML030171]OVZ66223.1 hypothetical protein CDO46_01575 [Pigmentiphaga sp. NML030171]
MSQRWAAHMKCRPVIEHIGGPGHAARRQAPQLLVTLRNHAHLAAVYGNAFAAAVERELQGRALAAGITSDAALRLGDDRFLLSPYPILTSESVSRERLLEYVLISLCSTPVEHGGQTAFALVEARLIDGVDTKLTDSGIGPGTATQPGFAPDQCTEAWRLEYAKDMSEALRVFQLLNAGRLTLAFQPIVARVDFSQQLYQEGLVRALDEDGEPVSLEAALKSLERVGLIRLFDRCVVQAVLALLRLRPALCLGCNISAQSVVVDSWWRQVLEDLEADPFVASRLVIELTENASFPGTDEPLEFVSKLQQLGCRIALDNFGSRFNTLDFSVRAKPAIIKIDNGYLGRGRSDGAARSVLTNLVQLCSRLADDIVIEGIESEADIDAVRRRMDVWLQGDFIGRAKVRRSEHGMAPDLLMGCTATASEQT